MDGSTAESCNGGADDVSYRISSSLGRVHTVPQPASVETVTPAAYGAAASQRGDGNNAFPSNAPAKKVIDVFYDFALAAPGRPLYDWLNDKGEIVNSYTRGELWNRGHLLADRLEKNGIKRGDFVMIVYP